jgi:Zn-finger nucleic acid-binding protein
MQIKADREEKRTCPIDGTRMNKEVIMNVVIDRCLSCHGVWLDGGELDLIKKAIVEKEGGDFVTGLIVGMAID